MFSRHRFPVGCVFASSFYFSPDHSNWWIPAFVVGSAIPGTIMVLATGPLVHAIKVRLPPTTRTSREELIRFADNTPPDAEVRLESMRALPWPTRRDVKFGLLRKYRPSLKKGLSNLEYVPEHTGEAKGHEDTWWHNMVKNFLGRFLVDNTVKDRSAAPGVWGKMWVQIPELGSSPVLRISKERKPAIMANRPQRVTNSPPRPTLKPGGDKR